MPTIRAMDASNGKTLWMRGVPAGTHVVSHPGYTPQTVEVYSDDGEVRVSLIPRFKML